MSQITPLSLAEPPLMVHVSPTDYDWNSQTRNSLGVTEGDANWLAASGSTGTETMTGNVGDFDSDDDARYD